MRKPLQGITNIIRFNWHYYFFAAIFIFGLISLSFFLPPPFDRLALIVVFLAAFSVILSLVASFYVYDLAGIYSLDWINKNEIESAELILNINAGFDETSHILKEKLANSKLLVYDFYDPEKHTEISIERARKAYPPFPNTKLIGTNSLPLESNSVDLICLIFAAHEIRDQTERIEFFRELNRVLKTDGKIYVAEHLRDFFNFSVYNVGFFHFFAKQNWLKVFEKAKFRVKTEKKLTPFISVFILTKNDTSA